MLDDAALPVIYNRDGLPVLQNRFYSSATEAQACMTATVRLKQHPGTGVVHNAAFDQRIVTYDAQYNNDQGASEAFRAHLIEVMNLIGAAMGRDGIVEIGCGKGGFLEQLATNGFDVVGYDPAYVGDNPRVERRLFSPDRKSDAKGLLLRHVLEHVPDPFNWLRQIAGANGGRGLVYIEVPCWDWIVGNKAWWDIFYEHVNYFRLSDFYRLFADVRASGRLFGGQYLYVIADLASIRDTLPPTDRVNPLGGDFLPNVHLDKSRPAHALWGAGSKAVIFGLIATVQGNRFTCAVDVNRAKQGLFMPVTGIPVVGPREALTKLPVGACIYVVNPNYLNEIKAAVDDRYEVVAVHEPTLISS